MRKLKVAILEDNKLLLKELKQNLEASGHVEVVAWALSAEELLEKVSQSSVEALILDIDIAGGSMNGTDAAYRLQLPVLFVSGKTPLFNSQIEDLSMNSKSVVQHITKPITLEKLNKILPKFIILIRSTEDSSFVYLDFSASKSNKIATSDIVYLESDKNFGAESNNKRIYFTHKPPQTLVDFSFVQMNKVGLSERQFIKTHRSFRVNVKRITNYNSSDHTVVVSAMDCQGQMQEFQIPVSTNFQKSTRDQLNNR